MTSPPRRVAVFDIGSNSVKLLAADVDAAGRLRVLLEKTAITRLGEGIGRGFRLREAAMARTLDALAAFKRRCRALGVREYRGIATSAVRDAANRRVFEKRFREKLGFSFQIVTGRHEAELIFRGATSDPRLAGKCGRIVVMDSGGGSAEWILGAGGTVKRRASLNLGCVRMTQRFLRGDPCTEESFRKMMVHYRRRLAPLRRIFSVRRGRLIATGGSITTAAALLLKLPACDSGTVHGCELRLRQLEELLSALRRMTHAQRVRLKNMEAQRADIIVAGVAIFVAAMRILGARRLRVSARALRYGALRD